MREPGKLRRMAISYDADLKFDFQHLTETCILLLGAGYQLTDYDMQLVALQPPREGLGSGAGEAPARSGVHEPIFPTQPCESPAADGGRAAADAYDFVGSDASDGEPEPGGGGGGSGEEASHSSARRRPRLGSAVVLLAARARRLDAAGAPPPQAQPGRVACLLVEIDLCTGALTTAAFLHSCCMTRLLEEVSTLPSTSNACLVLGGRLKAGNDRIIADTRP